MQFTNKYLIIHHNKIITLNEIKALKHLSLPFYYGEEGDDNFDFDFDNTYIGTIGNYYICITIEYWNDLHFIDKTIEVLLEFVNIVNTNSNTLTQIFNIETCHLKDKDYILAFIYKN